MDCYQAVFQFVPDVLDSCYRVPRNFRYDIIITKNNFRPESIRYTYSSKHSQVSFLDVIIHSKASFEFRIVLSRKLNDLKKNQVLAGVFDKFPQSEEEKRHQLRG